MVILLIADGQIAGAVEIGSGGVSGNALAYVGAKGKVQLICGTTLKTLAYSGTGHEGEVVRVSQSGKTNIYFSKQSVTADVIDVTMWKLGNRTIAEDAVVIDNGTVTSLLELGVSRVEKNRVAYYRANSANEVELIVLSDAEGNVHYGRAIFTTTTEIASGGGIFEDSEYEVRTLSVDSKGSRTTARTNFIVRTGDYVEAVLNNAGDFFTNVTVLTRLVSVSGSAWIGDTAVNYAGQTYTVPSTVICYNRDADAWFDDLDAAKAYGGTMDLYVKDGVVRVIEVRA